MPPTSPRQRALVTGASGFVGAHLVRRLAADGWTVRATARAPWTGVPAGIEQAIVGDLGPATEWMAALADVDVVFHLAGRAHVLSETSVDPAGEFRRVNAAGTARLSASAGRAGVRRLVFVSSVGVHGERTDGHAFTESSPIAPANDYASSKALAEDALRAESRGRLEYVILRPPLVYGPEVPGNLRRLLRLVASGVPLPLERVRNRRSLVAVENLVDALAVCAGQPRAAGQAYLVADGEDLSTPQLVRVLAQGMGVPARLLPVPVALAQFAASVAGFGAAFRQLCSSLEVNASKLRNELGWTPPVPADAALRATGRHYAEHRLHAAQRG
jgi:nucleoside-diphosphate-sugar epimerase